VLAALMAAATVQAAGGGNRALLGQLLARWLSA
jgi:hypothetical protein